MVSDNSPRSCGTSEQLSAILPALIAAGAVQALVFWYVGWRGVPVLLMPGLWVVMVASCVVAGRHCADYLRFQPKFERRLARKIAVVGYDEHALIIAKRINGVSQYGFFVVGIFGDKSYWLDKRGPEGALRDLIDLSRRARLDCIIIALPPGRGHEEDIAGLVWQLRSVSADVLVAPYLMHGPNVLLPTQLVGPMSFTVLQRRPLNDIEVLLKCGFDYFICTLIFIPLCILFLAAAAAIKLDSPGPVLFCQPRFGLNNRQFTIFKFRTMYVDQTDLMAERQTSRDDKRVTRVGKLMRRLSIDEMPQILNVLRGEMSLVGPRPHAPHTRIDGELLDDVLVEYIMRCRVKPGITGWAQVNGARGQLMKPEDLRKRVRYDLEYIQRWSLLFDIKIIALTVLREVVSKHAF